MARLKQTLLKNIARNIDVRSHLDIKEFLAALYSAFKSKNKRYSYVEFAADLGFGPTNVIHLVIRGKRPLGLKSAEKIAAALSLSNQRREYFLTLTRYHQARDLLEREELFRQLIAMRQKTIRSEEQRSALHFFSEWYHVAIYEMIALGGFHDDPSWVATHLTPKIRPEQARRSLNLLLGLGLVRRRETDGVYVQTNRRVTTGDEIASLAVVRYHQKMIEIGRESITTMTESNRDISAATFAISRARLDEFKAAVSEFRKKILDLADECTCKDQVFQINIQLFPLCKEQEEPL